MRILDTTGRTELYPALARENLLLDGPTPAEPMLLLWRGPKAVVMGKNQNPWRECNLAVVRERGLSLARRVSGGGAVYHDPGNLNFSWILPRTDYRGDAVRDLLIRALGRLGLDAAEGPAGGVRVGRFKVSGAAYCYRRDTVLHHGTLLIDADLAALRSALAPPRMRMDTHAVASIPAQVANLTDLDSTLTLDVLRRAYLTEAEAAFGAARPLGDDAPGEDNLAAEAARLADPAWIWGQTPAFRAEIEIGGHGRLAFQVRKGMLGELRWNDTPLEGTDLPFTAAGLSQLAHLLGLAKHRLQASFERQGWDLER